jgi:hypothetical protein
MPTPRSPQKEREMLTRTGKEKLKKTIIRPVPRTRILTYESTLNRQLKAIFYRILDEASDKLKPYAAREAYIPAINVDAIGKKYENDIYAAISNNKYKALETIAAYVSKQFSSPVDKRYFNQTVVPTVMNRTFKIVTTKITGTIAEELKAVLEKGAREGASASQLMKHFDMLELNHATIARTEMNTLANEASYSLSTKELGEIGLLGTATKGWTTAGDEKVREAHVQAGNDYGNGREIGIADAFIVDGESLAYPADYAAGSAGNIINCRCGYYILPAGTR